MHSQKKTTALTESTMVEPVTVLRSKNKRQLVLGVFQS